MRVYSPFHFVYFIYVLSYVANSYRPFSTHKTVNLLSAGRKSNINRNADKIELLNGLKEFGGKKDELRNLMGEVIQDFIDSLDEDEPVEDISKGKGADSMFNSVVRVYCTHSEPNFGMPWQRKRQEFSSSSGFMIEGNYILTNAHAVEYGSLIQVKKHQSERKFVASAVAIGHECDLALLRVEEHEEFWKDCAPLTFGELPDLHEDVAVVGYPVGGDSISISSGVVSRIEMQEYAQASAELLAIQIDAAINPGNSGGPVVNGADEVIGVAFQSLSSDDTENIGYVVPVTIINHFLRDVRTHGAYSGVCGVGIRVQQLENPMLRSHVKMAPEDTGILVLRVDPLSPANAVIKAGDVVLDVDGVRVANDGTIPFREGSFKERVHFSYLFTLHFPGEAVAMRVLRDGKYLNVSVPLYIPQRLVPRNLIKKNVINEASSVGTGSNGSIVGGSPSYVMIGGLVFTSLCREYLEEQFHVDRMNDFERFSNEFRILQLSDAPVTKPDEEAVLLSQVIANDCNVGYEMLENILLKSLQGIPILNLKHLKTLLDEFRNGDSQKKQDKLVFEFSTGLQVVLDTHQAFVAQEKICREHFIPSYCSPDLEL